MEGQHMKKETFLKTREAMDNLRHVLVDGEIDIETRTNILQAFNTLSDFIKKPLGKHNALRVDSYMGTLYVYFNEYRELVILDSDKRQICFLEDIDNGKEFDIYKQLEVMGNPMKLLDLGFCAEVYYDNDMDNFIKNLKKYDLFETSNPQSEIYRVGMFYLFFVY